MEYFISLDKLFLLDAFLVCQFSKFLEDNYLTETSYFIKNNCDLYHESNPKIRYQQAVMIYYSSIILNSQKQVNISSKLRNKIISEFHSYDSNNCPKDIYRNILNELIIDVIGYSYQLKFYETKISKIYFYKMITNKINGFDTKNKVIEGKFYKNIFYGSDISNWINKNVVNDLYDIGNINIMFDILKNNWFICLKKNSGYLNENYIYQFKYKINKINDFEIIKNYPKNVLIKKVESAHSFFMRKLSPKKI